MKSTIVAVLAVVGAVSSAPCAAAAPPDCAVKGTRMHWIADYCMANLQTDDEIAAGDCINAEASRKFAGECRAKTHYKKSLCTLVASRKHVTGIDRCMADKDFMGSTVRQKGVGG